MAGARVMSDIWIAEYMTPYDVYLHGVTEVLAASRTPFQDMQIVVSGSYGRALILDGKWQSSVLDEHLYHEPLVQVPCVVHGGPKRVLVLGGGEGATVREALRWRTVERVVMVDIDGEVVEACRRHLSEMHAGAFDDPRTEVRIADARDALGEAGAAYDVVISDLSDPIEEGPSFELFTQEMFEKVKAVLRPGGVFAIQAGPVAPAEMALHVRLHRTVASVFPHVASYSSHVPTYGAPWGYVVATLDKPIPSCPDPAAVDALLEARTTGGLRMLDGRSYLGLFQVPLDLRRAIASERRVYTLKEPPRFFGTGGGSDRERAPEG